MLESLLDLWWSSPDVVYSDEYVVRSQTDGYCRVMPRKSLGAMTDDIIEREIVYHRHLGRSFEWTQTGFGDENKILDRLESHGFVIGTKEVICLIDLEAFDLSERSEIRVERVQDEQGLADFRAVAEEVFEKDFAYTTGVLRECLASGSRKQIGFVGYDGGYAVSIGRLDTQGDSLIGGLYTGGTRKEYRGRGFYRAVVGRRAEYARELGLRYLSVDARPTSLPILRRLGFEEVVESWPCEWKP
ncbi:MAG: hypothetical protein JST51_07020 [Armatimonadetes bacterium]|nr:hypothetical protein [Armatimonadota bacterium]